MFLAHQSEVKKTLDRGSKRHLEEVKLLLTELNSLKIFSRSFIVSVYNWTLIYKINVHLLCTALKTSEMYAKYSFML